MRSSSLEKGDVTLDEFTIAVGFEKWADLDDTAALPKAMGAETFRKFEEKMQAIETNVEEYVLAYQRDLSYYPGGTQTSSRSQAQIEASTRLTCVELRKGKSLGLPGLKTLIKTAFAVVHHSAKHAHSLSGWC